MSTIPSPRRSLLFTPANRPALFAKALASGTDMICIDLEDAVAPDQKDSSRADALNFLMDGNPDTPERIVRINSPETKAGQTDLEALADTGGSSGIILVPKVNSADEIQALVKILAKAGCTVGIITTGQSG